MKTKLIYIFTLIYWGVYVYLGIAAPTTSNPYNISENTRILLQWSINLPILIIWLSGVYGAVNLRAYAKSVSGTKDGYGMQFISAGINLIVAHLFITSIFSTIRPYIVDRAELIRLSTIASNFEYILIYLIAFGILFYGSFKLLDYYKEVKFNFNFFIISVFILLIAIYFYLEFIFSNPNRLVANGPNIPASYYLRDSMIVLTVVIPSFATWLMGILTVSNLLTLSGKVTGIIYKKGIANILQGLIFIIIASVIIQGFTSVGSERLIATGLTGILIIIYVLLLIMVIGYLKLARGARSLEKIENV